MSGVLHGVVASLKAAAAAATDSFFKYVTLLLHGDGTNGAQNNTFLDGSTNAFTITRNGNTTQGTFSPFSQTGWSNFFDGTGDYLTINFSSGSTIAGDFTWECFAYDLGTKSFGTLMGWRTGASGWSGFLVQRNNGSNLVIFINNGTTITQTSNTYVSNAWNHVALTRSSTTVTLWVNGVSSGTATVSGSFDPGSNYWIGSDPFNNVSNVQFAGYISNQRFVNGTALYTAAFTPPTAPLTSITNTSLLTCQSNRFIDNSSNNFAITRNGDVRVEAFSPFNPSTTYSTANVGGSGYFDGAGDYLTAPASANLELTTGDFTVEAWVYFSNTTGLGMIAYRGQASPTLGSQIQWSMYRDGTSVIVRPYSGTTTYSINVGTVIPNTWYHVAFTRSSDVCRGFLNGVVSATTYTLPSLNNDSGWLGAYVAIFGTDYLAGYISNLRIVKGTAVYTANFTPPTAPLTAITNTQLLLNFTNGGIFDNASQTVLETVGNAQVSTTQKKFGTGSMLFDGTGDWLTALDRPPLRFGTGPFTIEMWVYRAASGTYGLVAKGTGTTGWLVSLNASNQVVFTFASSTITSTGTVAATTWTHIAVVREGTGANQTKIYISGTNDGTGTVSTDFSGTDVMYVGADRTAGSNFNGYIDDLRITNGCARYTANFTPPTAAFPDN